MYYSLARWDALTLYIEDKLLEIDNNPVYREIQAVALGRNNILFTGYDADGRASAMLYGFFEIAELDCLGPEACMRHVCNRIAVHPVNCVDEFQPWNANLESTIG